MSLSSFYKKPQPRGYSNSKYYIEDISASSPYYFNIQQFPSVVGGGKSVIVIKGNGDNLRLNSTIDVEVIDANGDNVFVEMTNYIDRFNNYYITFEVYDITAKGPATVYLVGEALIDEKGDPIPVEYQGNYNVRWSGNTMLLPFERNNADLYFDKPPSVSIVQVITPERALISEASGSAGSAYLVYTSSKDDYTIQTSNFQGYDRDFSTSTEILDTRLQSILANPNQKPSTTNTINSSLRRGVSDIENGYLKEQSSRFGTIVTSASGSIKKDFLGATFNFFSSESSPKNLYPALPVSASVSGSVYDQLAMFEANVVEVISSTQMVLSKPLSVVMLDTNQKSKNYTTTFNYKKATNFTGSLTYLPSDGAFVTSSTVSQSYLETTFSDLKPISGEVYRIKTYYKRGIATGEYKLIYDHVVSPVEYLTDAAYPNQTSYAKHDSDYRLIGHFTTDDIIDHYWDFYVETSNAIYISPTPNIVSSSLHESIPVNANYSQSYLATTKYNQNYNANQIYTLSCLIAMDPNTEVEVYMNSEPVSTNTYIASSYPRAFSKTINKEKDRYGDSFNRFGKYLGKIINDSNKAKYYGRVEFDFLTDNDGLGRPLFRANTIDRVNTTGSAYVAEIGIKPLTMNGFSPNLVQFSIPFNNEIDSILSLSQSLDFKIEYFDYTGKQSEYVTNINDLVVNLKGEIPSNTCQADTTYFYALGTTENY